MKKIVNYFTRKSDVSEAFVIYQKAANVIHGVYKFDQTYSAASYANLACRKIRNLKITKSLSDELCCAISDLIEEKLDEIELESEKN